MTRIEFVYHDGGGGHHNAATALEAVIAQQGRPWEVSLLNLQTLLDPIDLLRQISGVRIQECYNALLRNGWTLGSAQLLRVLQLTVRIYHRTMVRRLERHWRESRPDLVVSLIPHFNCALYQSYARAFPGRPFVTVLTDLADYPPHFWIERQPQYFVCGTERAVEQARALGHPDEHIFQASGMILQPRFYEPSQGDPAEGRRRLGLDPDLATALVLFGGHGSKVMLEITERLNTSQLQLQLILICGRNEELANALREHDWRFPVFVEGFTKRVNEYMRLADFFIGKPGPGSISEALAMGLPVIVECNAWTLPQERYNASWVREKQAGLVVKSFRQVERAVSEMLEPENIARFKASVARLENRAVFEIPEALAKVLAQTASTPLPVHASLAVPAQS